MKHHSPGNWPDDYAVRPSDEYASHLQKCAICGRVIQEHERKSGLEKIGWTIVGSVKKTIAVYCPDHRAEGEEHQARESAKSA